MAGIGGAPARAGGSRRILVAALVLIVASATLASAALVAFHAPSGASTQTAPRAVVPGPHVAAVYARFSNPGSVEGVTGLIVTIELPRTAGAFDLADLTLSWNGHARTLEGPDSFLPAWHPGARIVLLPGDVIDLVLPLGQPLAPREHGELVAAFGSLATQSLDLACPADPATATARLV